MTLVEVDLKMVRKNYCNDQYKLIHMNKTRTRPWLAKYTVFEAQILEIQHKP